MKGTVPFLETVSMSAGYEGRTVISDIDLNLGKGEILSLIGPNGSGKSTILKAVTGQIPYTGGSVRLFGKELKTISPKQRALLVASALTSPVKTPMMTCFEAAAAGRYPHTGAFGLLTKEDREKTMEALSLVEAADIAGKMTDRVSDGQRQRVMLARAVCQDTPLIILDEPATFLDIRHRTEFLTLLRELTAKKEIAVLMATHEIEGAVKISDRVICIKEGRKDREGDPHTVCDPAYLSELFGLNEEFRNKAENMGTIPDILKRS